MKRRTGIWLTALLVMLLDAPVLAQVSRVIADAKGITWPSCAAIMEIALRRLDGVDKVSISISEQRFQITYKPGAHFEPSEIRDALAQADVDVVRFRIIARGRVLAEGARQFFVAGKDKFVLPASPKIPLESVISVEGTIDDTGGPLRLKILTFKPLN